MTDKHLVTYRAFARGLLIGTSDLEDLDFSMGLAHGRMHPSPDYETCRPVFRMFTAALPVHSTDATDQVLLAEYYRRRDQLDLTVRVANGRQLHAEWIHVEDFDDPSEIRITISAPSDLLFWRDRGLSPCSPPVPIFVGAIVQGPHGTIGIACELASRPDDRWIRDQIDYDRLKDLSSDVQWWGVAPLSGGYALVPEPHLQWIRNITHTDFVEAVEKANDAGRVALARLFPDMADRFLSTTPRDKF